MALDQSGTVSERHAAARSDSSKMTAGQLATRMRRAGYQVTARELARHATEWHHAGWNPRGGMGKCYFFRDADAEPSRMADLFARVERDRAETAAAEQARLEDNASVRYGWRVGFVHAGRKGKWQPVAQVREFAVGVDFGRDYTRISAEEYAALLPFQGRSLERHETREAFVAREQAWEAARAARAAVAMTVCVVIEPEAQPVEPRATVAECDLGPEAAALLAQARATGMKPRAVRQVCFERKIAVIERDTILAVIRGERAGEGA